MSTRPPLEHWVERAFGDAEATRFGSGWISGTASVFLGALALLGVLAFWFPGALSSAAFRAHYPIPLLRALLEITIGLAFLLGALSLVLRRRKVLGLTGIGLALGATLAGGGSVPIESAFDKPVTIGLDWFLLNLFLLTLVFVPLERAFPRLPQQTTFRVGWTTDGAHHWHHAVAPIDKNFAVHLPVLDALFGTLHLPGDAWPTAYGIEGHPVPEGWGAQLLHPFWR